MWFGSLLEQYYLFTVDGTTYSIQYKKKYSSVWLIETQLQNFGNSKLINNFGPKFKKLAFLSEQNRFSVNNITLCSIVLYLCEFTRNEPYVHYMKFCGAEQT